MKEMRYMISDAAKKINVEPHVLRYWEEELEVGIPRNEMGHRYYREEDIRMMQGVKYLKERGFQLKSIKILLPDAEKVMQLPHRRLLELRDRLELAVSREELRLQREKELQNCAAEERAQASADTQKEKTVSAPEEADNKREKITGTEGVEGREEKRVVGTEGAEGKAEKRVTGTEGAERKAEKRVVGTEGVEGKAEKKAVGAERTEERVAAAKGAGEKAEKWVAAAKGAEEKAEKWADAAEEAGQSSMEEDVWAEEPEMESSAQVFQNRDAGGPSECMASGAEQEEVGGRISGCEGSSKIVMENETRKAAGERMKHRTDKQEVKTIAAQAMSQEGERGIAPGGQAARLIEMWQSKNTDSKQRKKTGAQQNRPAGTVSEPGLYRPSKTLPNCPAADSEYTSEIIQEAENAAIQSDFELRTQAEMQNAGMQLYSGAGISMNASGENRKFQNPLPDDSDATVRISDNAVRMQQFKGIMNEIITDAMRENNRELAGSITSSVSKEMEYHMRKREIMLEEHFKQLDRTLREYQLGQKQAAVAKECGRRESRFFRKNKKVRI